MFGIIRSGYTLKLRNFEGPLDLLTELINEAKLDITEIALSEVTDQYLNYLKMIQFIDIDQVSEFFLIAAILVYSKSRRLLPQARNDEQENLDETELLNRLKEYKKFRYLGKLLSRLKEEGSVFYPRGFLRNPMGISNQYNLNELSVGDLINAIRKYRGAFIKKPIPIKRREVRVEQKMEFIMKLLRNRNLVRYSEIIAHDSNKIEKIASFLGAMELNFRQRILLRQMKLFTDIELLKREEIRLS